MLFIRRFRIIRGCLVSVWFPCLFTSLCLLSCSIFSRVSLWLSLITDMSGCAASCSHVLPFVSSLQVLVWFSVLVACALCSVLLPPLQYVQFVPAVLHCVSTSLITPQCIYRLCFPWFLFMSLCLAVCAPLEYNNGHWYLLNRFYVWKEMLLYSKYFVMVRVSARPSHRAGVSTPGRSCHIMLTDCTWA